MNSFQKLQEGIDPKYFENLKECYPLKSNEGNRISPYVIVSSNKFVLHPVFQSYKFNQLKKELEERRKLGLNIPEVVAIGKNAVLFEYMLGVELRPPLEDSEVDKIAKIHRLFVGEQVNAQQFYRTVEKIKNNADTIRLYLGEEIKKLVEVFEDTSLEDHLFFTHGDWSYMNLLKERDIIKIIDLEQIDYAPQEYDLFRPLIRICNSEEQRKIYLSNFQQISEKKLIAAALMFYTLKISRHKYGFIDDAKQAGLCTKKILDIGFDTNLEEILKELKKVKRADK
ncbi:MAG: hypothetical protein AABX39_06785 [Nanoarchaeota archaeon]